MGEQLHPMKHNRCTVYPKKYAHGVVVFCFVVVMQSFIMNSHEVFIHIHQGCFAGTGAIVRLPQCQWSKPDGYGKISQCITTTKHNKAKTMCIFFGIYCSYSCHNNVLFLSVWEIPGTIYSVNTRDGVNNPLASILMSCNMIAMFIYWLTRSYLAGVAAVQLLLHMSNMNLILICQHMSKYQWRRNSRTL